MQKGDVNVIIVNEFEISNIPVIEMVEKDATNKKLPLAFFLHGFTNQKEHGLMPGYEMARQGMRVIIPDAFLHGERKDESFSESKERAFWEIEWKTVHELPDIVDYYISKGLAAKNDVSVTGLSMGGIAVCMAMVKYPWIRSAACLMGNPNPLHFTNWLLTSKWQTDREELQVISPEAIDEMMKDFIPLTLQAFPEKIAGRPFYIWHGKADDTVPFSHMQHFANEVVGKDYARQVHVDFYEGYGHKVPLEIFKKMALFLASQ